MTDLKINNATNSLAFSNGDIVLTTQGLDAVAQRLSLRFGLFFGEWFLNTSDGTPWREQILVRPVDLSVVRGVLINRALTCKGVASVSQFDVALDRDTRQLTFTFRVGIDTTIPGLGGPSTATGEGLVSLDDPTGLCLIEMSGSFF